MKTSLILAVILMACGCSKRAKPTLAESVQAKNTAASVTVDAAKYLRGLREQGQLPGLSKDDHGELKAKVADFSETVRFPISLTFQFRKSDGSVYHCTVEQLSATSAWRLTRAWQADASGKIEKEFPVE